VGAQTYKLLAWALSSFQTEGSGSAAHSGWLAGSTCKSSGGYANEVYKQAGSGQWVIIGGLDHPDGFMMGMEHASRNCTYPETNSQNGMSASSSEEVTRGPGCS
jgi:hypothetical protein